MSDSDKQRSQLSDHAATRRQLLLALPALCLVAPAFASKTPQGNIERIKLPDAEGIAVSVRVKGKFTSVYTGQERQIDLPTTLCYYGPEEQPTAETMDEHEIGWMPSILEEGWGAFTPTGETLTYAFDITDDKAQLASLQFRDMETNRVLATLRANAAGTALQGQVVVPADTSKNYTAEGVDRQGKKRFDIGTNYGNADKFVFYVCAGSFEPHRPASVSCADLPDRGKGPIGSIGDWRDVRSSTISEDQPASQGNPAYSNTSILDVYKSEENDRGGVWHMSPPNETVGLVMRKVLHNGVDINVRNSRFQPDDLAKLGDLIFSLQKPDNTPVLTDITMPPYSENCGEWRAQLIGIQYGVLAFPYNRAKNYRSVVDSVLALFRLPIQVIGKALSEALVAAGVKQLTAPNASVPAKLIAKEMISMGDLYILEAAATGTDLESNSIYCSVVVIVNPEPAEPNHLLSFEGSVKLVGPNTMPSPPAFDGVTTFTLFFNEYGTARVILPKGWKWKFTGKVKSTDYDAGVVPFNTPAPDTVQVVSKKK